MNLNNVIDFTFTEMLIRIHSCEMFGKWKNVMRSEFAKQFMCTENEMNGDLRMLSDVINEYTCTANAMAAAVILFDAYIEHHIHCRISHFLFISKILQSTD